MNVIQKLPEGALDVVGDVHGEWSALQALLAHLGYREDGTHPDGRTLVFVGDLVDRGESSPAVLDWVLPKVADGRVVCVIGNHELNLIRGDAKEGNGWFFEPNHDHAEGKFRDAPALPRTKRAEVVALLDRLPIAAERSDLRIVHACWDPVSLNELTTTSAHHSGWSSCFEHYQRRLEEQLRAVAAQSGFEEECRRFEQLRELPTDELELHSPADYPLLARYQELEQNGNPVRVLTSGKEEINGKVFHAGGKPRLLRRVNWWDRYADQVAVIYGHHWRKATNAQGPDHWYGAPGTRPSAYCVDFSVGSRFDKRAQGQTDHSECRLGAVRWPEATVMFDDGESVRTQR